ncbi:MAG: rRNA cytosine-C5-methylase [Rikenellaceae bacterium]
MSNNTTTPPLPTKFIERNIEYLGAEDANLFFASLETQPPVSVRYNPYKTTTYPQTERVGWCQNGYYLRERTKFTLDPLFHAGVYYPQEASSMFLEQYIEKACATLGRDLTVLDLCAAPGGKSTHLSALLTKDSVVVSNETIKPRAKVLAENIEKWGVGNVIVTCSDPERFTALQGIFDIVLIDTPCSGEGMFRKTPDSRGEWSEESVRLCAARSRRIVASGYNSLREGGILIYSTCTYNTIEDEQTVEWIAKTYNMENFSINPCDDWSVMKTQAAEVECYKFMPHRTKGEGFFITAMQKTEPTKTISVSKNKTVELASKLQTTEAKRWINCSGSYSIINHDATIYCLNENYINLLNIIKQNLYIITFGTEIGKFFANDFKPAHPLALFIDSNETMLPKIDVDLQTAQEYLRKNVIDPSKFEQGINIVSYNNQAIGYIKRIGTRCNNLYPKEYRIFNL